MEKFMVTTMLIRQFINIYIYRPYIAPFFEFDHPIEGKKIGTFRNLTFICKTIVSHMKEFDDYVKANFNLLFVFSRCSDIANVRKCSYLT